MCIRDRYAPTSTSTTRSVGISAVTSACPSRDWLTLQMHLTAVVLQFHCPQLQSQADVTIRRTQTYLINMTYSDSVRFKSGLFSAGDFRTNFVWRAHACRESRASFYSRWKMQQKSPDHEPFRLAYTSFTFRPTVLLTMAVTQVSNDYFLHRVNWSD